MLATRIDTGWTLAVSPPGAWLTPDACPGAEWLPAIVPGTAAAALEQIGLWDRYEPAPLHDRDVWYRTTFEAPGPAVLVFEGLATITEVWVNGQLVARSETMFTPLEVALDRAGDYRLALAFRSLAVDLAARKGTRARWRTRMVEDARLRFVRTTMMGHAPGWCPPIHVVGPWRPVRLRLGTNLSAVQLSSRLCDTDGCVTVTFDAPALAEDPLPQIEVGCHRAALERDADGRWHAALRIPNPALWWPRTHGDPALYDVVLITQTRRVPLGRIGFRDVSVDTGPDGDGFAIAVNGVPVFCRGVCWTPELVSLGGTRQDYEPTLRLLADGNVNMIRVGGTGVYEAEAFHALCDELGIMVWQDCMLANFDYPREDGYVKAALAEVEALLDRTAGSPSLIVVCGGSEIAQQATMMGLRPDGAAHPLFDTALPDLIEKRRPDVIFVPGSPSRGVLPFVANAGPSHYYGVGAYQRPLDDARRAEVRFASECLAFANVPEDATLRRHRLDPIGNAEKWTSLIPRDAGADWTFEDTRHAYMTQLYGDAKALRATNSQRYLDLSRAVTAEVTERVLDEWRRPGSRTAGALVWFARDFLPAPGWGVIDAEGRPKSNFHALSRAFAPLRLSITDEGVNGLVLHAINDRPQPLDARLSIVCLRHGSVRVEQGAREITIPAHGGVSIPAFALFGRFFDAGCAYPFGAPPHDTVSARLDANDGTTAEAHWLLEHARHAVHDDQPELTIEPTASGWDLIIIARRALHFVVIADETLVPDDNWFHLVPGRPKRVALKPLAGLPQDCPRGSLRALNLATPLAYDASDLARHSPS